MRALLQRRRQSDPVPRGNQFRRLARAARSAHPFFAVAEPTAGENPADLPLIQPVSVVYDRLGGLPAGTCQPPGVRLVRRHGHLLAFSGA